MCLKLWYYLRKKFLKKVYGILVVKTQVIDKSKLYHYSRYPTFATIKLPTNKGEFTFVFKEDRRKRVRERDLTSFHLVSYFVELESPTALAGPDNPLHDKVIVMVKIGSGRVQYDALGELLIDLYVDYF